MGSIIIKQPKTSEVEGELNRLSQVAASLEILDDNGLKAAAEFAREVKTRIKQVTELFKEPKQAAFKAHRSITAAEKKLLEPLKVADQTMKDKIIRYSINRGAELERERQAMEERAREEEENRRIAEAEALEAAGEHEQAQAVLDEPIVTTQVVGPEFETPQGVHSRITWRAQVVDLRALCAAVAEGTVPMNLVQPNMQALNELAKAGKELFRLPGVEPVKSEQIVLR